MGDFIWYKSWEFWTAVASLFTTIGSTLMVRKINYEIKLPLQEEQARIKKQLANADVSEYVKAHLNKRWKELDQLLCKPTTVRQYNGHGALDGLCEPYHDAYGLPPKHRYTGTSRRLRGAPAATDSHAYGLSLMACFLLGLLTHKVIRILHSRSSKPS